MNNEYVKWIRRHVGNQKILLVSACACVRDEADRVLWQRRSDFDVWALPGGMLELDESLAECVVREVEEETGLIAKPVRLLGVYSSPDYEQTYPNGDRAQAVTICFECRVAVGSLRADGVETLDLAWFAPAESPAAPTWCRAIMADLVLAQKEASFRRGRKGARQNDVPFFKQVRRHIGQARFIVPGAAAFIQNEAGQILLQRRGDTGAWGLLGGGMELGERIDQTIVNEVREESGLTVEPVRLIGVYSDQGFHFTYPHGDRLKVVSFFFECRITGGDLQPDGEETLELRFFPPHALPPLAERHARRIRDALAGREGAIF